MIIVAPETENPLPTQRGRERGGPTQPKTRRYWAQARIHQLEATQAELSELISMLRAVHRRAHAGDTYSDNGRPWLGFRLSMGSWPLALLQRRITLTLPSTVTLKLIGLLAPVPAPAQPDALSEETRRRLAGYYSTIPEPSDQQTTGSSGASPRRRQESSSLGPEEHVVETEQDQRSEQAETPGFEVKEANNLFMKDRPPSESHSYHTTMACTMLETRMHDKELPREG